MATYQRTTFSVLFFLFALALPAADPVVSKVRSIQRSGTQLVDITYDLADPDNSQLTVSVAVSDNAARGGTSGHRFPWSNVNTITHSQANYYSDSSYSYDLSSTRGYHPNYQSGGYPYTSPVGSFPAGVNGYGLHDMAGNVWEWCWDWYGSSYYSASPGTDSSRTLQVIAVD